MNLSNLLVNETFITSAVFNDEALEITFMEKGQQASKVMQLNTIAFPIDGEDPEKVDIVAQIQDLLRELIDRAYAERRSEHNGESRAARRRLTDIDPDEV